MNLPRILPPDNAVIRGQIIIKLQTESRHPLNLSFKINPEYGIRMLANIFFGNAASRSSPIDLVEFFHAQA
jgi:hypothetical protein